jgi:hypothetical protein
MNIIAICVAAFYWVNLWCVVSLRVQFSIEKQFWEVHTQRGHKFELSNVCNQINSIVIRRVARLNYASRDAGCADCHVEMLFQIIAARRAVHSKCCVYVCTEWVNIELLAAAIEIMTSSVASTKYRAHTFSVIKSIYVYGDKDKRVEW